MTPLKVFGMSRIEHHEEFGSDSSLAVALMILLEPLRKFYLKKIHNEII